MDSASVPSARPSHAIPTRVSRAAVVVALLLFLVVSLLLLPSAGDPFDNAAIFGHGQGWLDWGYPLFYKFQYGVPVSITVVLAACLRLVLMHAGLSGVAATHVALKLPLLVCSLGSALMVGRLTLRFRPEFADWAVAAWLVGPATLWVTAGHAEVDPLAVFALLWSVDLACRRRWFWAAAVAGAGAGAEYLPLVAALVPVVWALRGDAARRRMLLETALGLLGSLGVCFGPMLAGPFGRASLLGSLVGHAAGGASFVSLLSLWPVLVHYVPLAAFVQAYWIPLWLSVAAMWIAWSIWRRTEASALVAAGGVLLSMLLLYPQTLPVFALLGQAALILMFLGGMGSPLVLVLPPLLQVLTYFLTENIYTFFWDIRRHVFVLHGLLPSFASARVAGFVSTCAVLVFALAPWSHLVVRVRGISRWAMALLALPTLCCLGIGLYAAQPPLWRNITGNYPRQLGEYAQLMAVYPASVHAGAYGNATLVLPESDVTLLSALKVRPTLLLQFSTAVPATAVAAVGGRWAAPSAVPGNPTVLALHGVMPSTHVAVQMNHLAAAQVRLAGAEFTLQQSTPWYRSAEPLAMAVGAVFGIGLTAVGAVVARRVWIGQEA